MIHRLGVRYPSDFETDPLSVTESLRSFEPAQFCPEWAVDTDSYGRQVSLLRLVDLLEAPLSKPRIPGLNDVETVGRKIHDNWNTDSREFVVRIGETTAIKKLGFPLNGLEYQYTHLEPIENLALRIDGHSGYGAPRAKWMIPIPGQDLLEIDLIAMNKGSATTLVDSPAVREDVETALNQVGNYFQDNLRTAEEAGPMISRVGHALARLAFRP